MKVGTDGVLLGAWAPVESSKRILDVGTGTGLISLQLAQRNSDAIITAIEIDEAAAGQAKENVARSPWSNRIEIVCCDFRNYASKEKFDLIASNPPYFIDALRCPDEQRRLARHTGELNYELLFRNSTRMLSEQGGVSIIVPAEVEKAVIDTVWTHKLFPPPSFARFYQAGQTMPAGIIYFRFCRNTLCRRNSLY